MCCLDSTIPERPYVHVISKTEAPPQAPTNLPPLKRYKIEGVTDFRAAVKQPQKVIGAFFRFPAIQEICKHDHLDFANRYD
jgi:hypothetical protein